MGWQGSFQVPLPYAQVSLQGGVVDMAPTTTSWDTIVYLHLPMGLGSLDPLV